MDPSAPPLLAHPSFDAWGFGVVLYEALAGEILFRRHGSNDNIQSPADQSRLCMWRSIDADLLSNIVGDEPIYEAARNLVAWCLQGDPNDRPTMAQILAHGLFKPSDHFKPLAAVPARKHVFLSHFQAEASGPVAAMHAELDSFGARAWLDMYEEDITEAGMRAGVEAADVFVCFLTSCVLTRPFCLAEFGWALDAQKPILLVREEDTRFAPWDHARWQNDEYWDASPMRNGRPHGWSRDLDAQYRQLESGPGRRVRDEIDRQAAAGSIITYRRRDFEAKAMIRELLRLAGQHPSVLWRPLISTARKTTTTLRLLFIDHETAGAAIRDRLLGSFGACVQRVASTAEADAVLAVLSRGVLEAASPSCQELEEALRPGGVPVRFVHSLADGWEFYGREHQAASDSIKRAIRDSESMEMRSAEYEHAAMVDELLRRFEAAARRRGQGAPPPPPPPPHVHR